MPRPLEAFHPAAAEWFANALGRPTRAQRLAWPCVRRGESTLLLAPTGSGKTLAAFFAAIDRLMWSPEPAREERCRILYVSPLKALAVDVEKNLRAPIAGVAEVARSRGADARLPRVAIRTGDTPRKDRAKMAREPPDILITTPESLYLLLTSRASEVLRAVDTVIVDEIHQLVPTKRGAHLFLSLERLEALRSTEAPRLQRIGLSATQRPLDEVARLLGGFERDRPRPVTIVDTAEPRPLELTVSVPEIDMSDLSRDAPDLDPSARTIWPHIHERVVELVRSHRSTMIFVNSRRLAERFAAALNEVAGEVLALAHHGSVAREKRAEIEDKLKTGRLPALVATSSLELGIDMGAVDLVIQVEAPPSVASGLQRIGRACHRVGGVPKGVIFPKHRGDLLACAAAVPSMRRGDVEETFYPRNPLDVLAQQIVAVVSRGPVAVDTLFALVRGAASYAELARGAFEEVLDMLSGRYPSDEFRDLRPLVTWDRVGRRLKPREGARERAVTNGGTIPDRGLYGVFLAGDGGESKRVGELDEEMVFELREGEVFLLGSSSWRAEEITHDRVLVSPAAGEPGKMPFWHGDRPGRPRAFGTTIGELARTLVEAPRRAVALLEKEHALDASAAKNLALFIEHQARATGEVPSDRTLVVERFADEVGDWRVVLLSPFGTRVHAPWATAVVARLRERYAGDVDVTYTDDGMAFRIPACDEPPPTELFFPASDEVEAVVTRTLSTTSLFAARFRECAARALLLPRRSPRARTPLWAQRRRAGDLLRVASRYPTFPIVLETYRECLRDVFDLPGLKDILAQVESRRLRVSTVDSKRPSPFASSVLFTYVASFIYDADAPLAEKRAQALTIDHAQLRELLGEVELRRLLDPESIAAHERSLQKLAHPAQHADAVHDMLLALGDLSAAEIGARADAPPRAWLEELVRDRRAIAIRIAGEERYAAAEDAGRLRDALGTRLQQGLPAAFLESTGDALAGIVARYARTHGPFTTEDVARRYALAPRKVASALTKLASEGRIVEGAFLPGGSEREYCDPEVLAALRRKSLARLRREIEPVAPSAFARFLGAWHALDRPRRGPDALVAAVSQIEGYPLPASVLEAEVLPARVTGYKPWDLDALCASGEVVWGGLEPLGASDGRLALYVAEHEPLLARQAREVPGERATKIRDVLARRGAVFFAEIAREVGGYPRELLETLWAMVWAGEVTNDTLEPLRSRLASKAKDETKRRPRDRPDPARSPRASMPGSEGRWSLRAARRGAARPGDTEQRAALARLLLDRYGVVTREAVHAEQIAGGFSAVYGVFKALEEAGRVRRGYFIQGRGGAEFALPGAAERLRAMREPASEEAPLVLASTDPANPYGACLDWPEPRGGAARPQRAAGAIVVLHRGELLAWLGRSERALLTFLPDDEPRRRALARTLGGALAAMLDASDRRALFLTTIDGDLARASPLAGIFAELGFVSGPQGLLRRRVAPPEATLGGL